MDYWLVMLLGCRMVIAFLDALLLHEDSGVNRVLILSPVNTIYNWRNEFDKWIPGIDCEYNVSENTLYQTRTCVYTLTCTVCIYTCTLQHYTCRCAGVGELVCTNYMCSLNVSEQVSVRTLCMHYVILCTHVSQCVCVCFYARMLACVHTCVFVCTNLSACTYMCVHAYTM